MATYESTQTTSFVSASSVTVTKPTSLAVGDVLVAHICTVNIGSDAGPFTLPSGWTEIVNQHANGASSPARNRMQIWWKTADSADVAASDFTFTAVGGPFRCAATLTRITNFRQIDGTSSTIRNNDSSSSVSFSGFTPTRANCLYLMFAQGGEEVGSDPTFSAYAIATSNPTWTERYDIPDSGSFGISLAMATATRPEKTATGNASFTASSLGTNSDLAMALVAIAPVLNVTSTPSPVASNAAILNVLHVRSATAGIVQPRTKQETVWTDETKTTTTWTDEIK